MKRKEITKEGQLPSVYIQSVEDFNQIGDETVKKWISDSYINPATADVAHRNFRLFYNWLQDKGSPNLRGKTPLELVKLQSQINRDTEGDSDEHLILNEVIRFIGSDSKWRTNYKLNLFRCVRGFFLYSTKPHGFPKIENGKKAIFVSTEMSAEKTLTNHQLHEIAVKSDKMHRAVWEIMATSGMGEGEIIELSERGIDSLKEALSNPVNAKPELIEIRLGGRKSNAYNGSTFYTYIGGSALVSLKEYLVQREEDRLNAEAEGKEFPKAVFVNQLLYPINNRGLLSYWLKKITQLGYYKKQSGKGRKANRTGLNPHTLRSIFRTNWEDSPAKALMGEYLLGHIVDPLNYNQFCEKREKRIEQYLKALPFVDLWCEKGKTELEQLKTTYDSEMEVMRNTISYLEVKLNDMEAELSMVKEVREELASGDKRLILDGLKKMQDLFIPPEGLGKPAKKE